MRLRFFEDYQNGKLPKALEAVKQKYREEREILVDDGRATPVAKRRSPRKNGHEANKSLFKPNLPYSPAERKDMSGIFGEQSFSERSPSLYRRADADSNVPFVGNTGCAMTQFSKRPKVRQLQRNKMFKKQKLGIQEKKEQFEKLFLEAKKRFEFRDAAPEDFVTVSDANEPQLLSELVEDPEASPLDIEDLALIGSVHEPPYVLWNTLKAIEIDDETEFIAQHRYYEVNLGSAIAASVKLFFLQCIRHDTDNTTAIKRIAFKYILRETSDMPYISVIVMTNKGLMGNKYVPFLFQYLLPAGRLTDIPSVHQLEGVWNIQPEYDSINEDTCKRRRMKYKQDLQLRNNIVQTVTEQYQIQIGNQIQDNTGEDLLLGSESASVNTYAIAELKVGKKQGLWLVKILTTGKKSLTLEVYKSGKSQKNWKKNLTSVTRQDREVIRVTGVHVRSVDDNWVLDHTPMVIIKNAEKMAAVNQALL